MSARMDHHLSRAVVPLSAGALFAMSLVGCTFGSAGDLSLAAKGDPKSFSRVAEWPVASNGESQSAEIIAASGDGQALLYTDSPAELLGFLNISDPGAPNAEGVLALEGEPTSVAVTGDHALVAVNTSESYVAPSGHIAVVDIAGQQIVSRCDVGGQPDSVAASSDGAFLAVAIENERDEDLNDGLLPQLPAGYLAIFDLAEDGTPANCADVRIVDLAGLADIAGDDAEPEYVSINAANVVAVTLQENNHVVLVDLATGDVVGDFSAGTVDLVNVDLTDDGQISMTESATAVPREPDAIAWVDDGHLVTANEGDYNGGGRGFTVFDQAGDVVWDSGSETEHRAAEAGLYPDDRSHKKGTEPETVAVGDYNGEKQIFVALERANGVMVYAAAGDQPVYRQLLATGVGPEGVLPLPERDLLIVANEADPEEGLASTIDIFQLTP